MAKPNSIPCRGRGEKSTPKGQDQVQAQDFKDPEATSLQDPSLSILPQFGVLSKDEQRIGPCQEAGSVVRLSLGDGVGFTPFRKSSHNAKSGR